ncbi:MAG: flavodoxin family protein [Clostridiales Family XIII bacterium]|jgi:multimeric flavodoxin WrbA|nr:flavodoxin family protein [Clostridiales Family XIII bacterium]
MKALLVNGSPNQKGNTYVALRAAADALEAEGVEAEIYQIPAGPVRGCAACGVCKTNGGNRCAFDGDAVNAILDKMEGADALIIGSPVYYASPNGQLLSVLDRVFFAGAAGAAFAGKPGAAVCAARRGGATATLDALQKYFPISGMPIVPATYWPMVHGGAPGEAIRDEEGVQAAQMVGKTTAWLLKCIEAGRAAGIAYPEAPGGKKVWTNFIRA